MELIHFTLKTWDIYDDLFQPISVDFNGEKSISVFKSIIIFILNVVVIAFLLVLFALYTNHNMH
jgi:hypothetical protein